MTIQSALPSFRRGWRMRNFTLPLRESFNFDRINHLLTFVRPYGHHGQGGHDESGIRSFQNRTPSITIIPLFLARNSFFTSRIS